MNFVFIRQCGMALGVSFLLTYLVTPLAERLASRLRMMDYPGPRRVHQRPTPRTGGIAVFLGFHAGCAALFLFPGPAFAGDLHPGWWLGFAVTSGALLLVGLADDALNLRPTVKLACQTGVALLAYALGHRIGTVLGTPLTPIVDLVLTVAWFLMFINVINLIDGMDGVATGLALVASLGIALALILRQRMGDVLVLLSLSGACLAFLRYNFHPARIFLGDSGSMFLGLTLAATSLATVSKSAALPSLLVPLLAVGIPLFDALLAVWRRSVRQALRMGETGQPRGVAAILTGDTDHLHHRLARKGLSQRQVAWLLYLFSGTLILIGLLLMTFRSYVVGISLTAFVAGVYVVVCHLAHVELWDTGTSLLRGLSRPSRHVLAVLLYPLVDLLIMALAMAFALHSLPDVFPGSFAARFLKIGVIWVGIPFMVLTVSGTYQRVWSRSGASEFAMLLISLGGGLLMAGGVSSLLLGLTGRDLFACLPLYGGLTLATLIGVRAIRPMLLDLMAYRWLRWAGGPSPRRLLLYGAGDRALLFLRELGYTAIGNPVHEQIYGLLDEDSNLYGRRVHGYCVLGGMDWLHQKSGLGIFDELVIVADLAPEERTRLLDFAEQRGFEVSEWQTSRCRVTRTKVVLEEI